LDKIETYEQFARNCEQNKNDFVKLLKQLKADGKRVVGYAATSKSTTVLNYCDIGPDLIEYICDTTPIKQGKFSPGMHIPIKSYEDFKNDRPDYAVLFAWNHAQEIFEKEKAFIDQGGKWIVFVPEVKVLSSQESLIQNVA
jgi:methylation protein EvaC